MTETFKTISGHLAYRKYIPNRIALGIPMTAKGEGEWISLPYLSILSPAAAPLERMMAKGDVG